MSQSAWIRCHHFFIWGAVSFALLAWCGLALTGADPVAKEESELLKHILELDFPHCFSQDVSLKGKALATETAESLLNCQEKCKESKVCEVFVFDEGGQCHHFSVDAVQGSEVKKGSVMGPKTCRDSCKEEGMIEGETIQVIVDGSASTLDECAALCHLKQPCTHASYDYLSDICFLIGAREGHIHRKRRGTASLSKRCEDRDSDVAKDRWLEGPDLVDNLRTESLKDCRERGQVTKGCAMWSWNSADKMCKLKDHEAFRIWKPNSGWFSGPTWPSKKNCLREGFKMSGNHVDGDPATSPEHCQLQCRARAGCGLFSFEEATLNCKLMAANSAPHLNQEAGWISGPAMCAKDDWCVEWGKLYDGGGPLKDEAPSRTVDAVECRRRCQEKGGVCVTWTFEKPSLTCTLRPIEGIRGRKNNAQYVSGQHLCGDIDVCDKQGAFYGESRYLKDISQTESAYACHASCFDDPRCYHFSYFDRTCRLYPKAVSQQERSGAVGGAAVC